jgi:hypothetical protein
MHVPTRLRMLNHLMHGVAEGGGVRWCTAQHISGGEEGLQQPRHRIHATTQPQKGKRTHIRFQKGSMCDTNAPQRGLTKLRVT